MIGTGLIIELIADVKPPRRHISHDVTLALVVVLFLGVSFALMSKYFFCKVVERVSTATPHYSMTIIVNVDLTPLSFRSFQVIVSFTFSIVSASTCATMS